MGLDTLKIGAYDAVVTYNTGYLGRIQVLQHLFGDAGANCVIGFKHLDHVRVRKADKKSQEVEMKLRKVQRKKKRKLEEIEQEDEVYGPGIDAIQ